MSGRRTLCMLFEAIGPYNSIGHVAQAEITAALDAGWQVTAVAKFLHESLHGSVEWVKLPVPSRGFALQWLTARSCYQHAIGKRLHEFDVVHGHQPQVADRCSVFQCHFLTRAAYERNCLYDGEGLRRVSSAIQNKVVLFQEDRFYRRWNPATHLLFNSALTRREFARFYGLPASEEVFLCPAPAVRPVSPEERAAARKMLLGPEPISSPVIGFLGGLQERKGYRRLIAGLQTRPDLFLLMGGQHSKGFFPAGLENRSRGVGPVDANAFYAACDLVAVTSHFEPFGLVALEAAARGIPSIATREVGALHHLLETGAGLEWDPATELLGAKVDAIMKDLPVFKAACLAWAETNSPAQHQRRLLEIYDRISNGKRRSVPSEPARLIS